MNEHEAEKHITVRRQWNDFRSATYGLTQVSGFHWSDLSGGVGARANRQYVHAYVSCETEPISGDLAHSCLHGPPPHRIKVCVVARDNNRRLMAEVKELASRSRG